MSDTQKAAGLTRRHMLGALSAAAATAAASPARAAACAADPPSPTGISDLARGSLSDWAALVGRSFRVAGATGAPLRLVAVEPVNSGGPRPGAVRRRRGFSAVFEAHPARSPSGDQAHWIAHGAAPPVPVFLSPPAEVSGRMRLVAVFN